MKKLFLLAASLLGVVAVPSFAATSYIDASVAPAIAQIGTDTGTIATYVWPVLLLALGIGIAMKLVKRFSGKA